MELDHIRLVLASQSPRRRELLTRAGLHPEVIVSGIEEHVTEKDPEKVVRELSRQKAENVANMLADRKNTVVIGADTVVCVDGKILGKPHTHEEAEKMIRLIAGRTHHVFSGVTILNLEKNIRDTFAEKTEVHVCPMTVEEIHDYAMSDEPMDKAGAYGIQGFFGRYISGISGDYSNVVGLPVCAVYHHLMDMNRAWLS